ncbi:ABC transporter ATP-binding protein [Roseomonas sp. CECT 9278]|uniref:ABC transporter ATP-binding protein n=1 Tax=Roseomonas sp. CECT 9278 TaxID=2845823 RepID=UPI001E4EB5D7|nr:ABC transporter ATP-binding protein [Roseomonas sp. CECT 9278]CAH0272728.1 High-affinity branched-chain amino acid transport ATP-binding protein LivF [Roseomonas sp. CECT 9278]
MSATTSAGAAAPALQATGLTAGFGGRDVLQDASLTLNDGEILCLIGHNGAGKSTLLRVLFGLHRPSAGALRVFGQQPAQHNPAAMGAAGVALVPEGRGVFPDLTVDEIFGLALWSAGVPRSGQRERIDEVLDVLPRIKEFRTRRAGTLSGGQQQMVSIGRALLTRPRVLLLDEPSIGLAPKLFQDLIRPIATLRQTRGMSILLVEQNVREAFAISDRVLVMRSGRFIFEGAPSELDDHAKLMELF